MSQIDRTYDVQLQREVESLRQQLADALKAEAQTRYERDHNKETLDRIAGQNRELREKIAVLPTSLISAIARAHRESLKIEMGLVSVEVAEEMRKDGAQVTRQLVFVPPRSLTYEMHPNGYIRSKYTAVFGRHEVVAYTMTNPTAADLQRCGVSEAARRNLTDHLTIELGPDDAQ